MKSNTKGWNTNKRIHMINFFIYWLPPLVWMGIISPFNKLLTSSSSSSFIVPILKWLFPYLSHDTVEIFHIVIRKMSHFLEYAFLAFLLFRAFRGIKRTWRLEWILYAGLIAIGYGCLDEYVQTMIPSRTGSVYDWLIDSSGAVFALGIISIKNKRLRDKD